MHHAFKTYFNAALVIPLLLWPVLLPLASLNEFDNRLRRPELRQSYLLLWVASKAWKYLAFGHVGTRNLSNISRNRYWVVPCKFTQTSKSARLQGSTSLTRNHRSCVRLDPVIYHRLGGYPFHGLWHHQITCRRALSHPPTATSSPHAQSAGPHAHALLDHRLSCIYHDRGHHWFPENVLSLSAVRLQRFIPPYWSHATLAGNCVCHGDTRSIYAVPTDRFGPQRVS